MRTEIKYTEYGYTESDADQLRKSAIAPALAVLNIQRISGRAAAGMVASDKWGSKKLQGHFGGGGDALAFGGVGAWLDGNATGAFEVDQVKADLVLFAAPVVMGETWRRMAKELVLPPLHAITDRGFATTARNYKWSNLEQDLPFGVDLGKKWLSWYEANKSDIKGSDFEEECEAILASRKPLKYVSVRPTTVGDWATIARIDEETFTLIMGEPSDIDDDDERSLQFWAMVRDRKLPVVVTEGIKKALALLSIGIVAISVPGVWMGCHAVHIGADSRLQEYTLSPTIKALCTGKVTIAFDSDDKPQTRKTVASAASRLGFVLSREGKDVRIASWPSRLGKGCDDVIFNGHDMGAILNRATPLDLWRTNRLRSLNWKIQSHLLSADLEQGRYIPSGWQFPTDKIVALKAPKGSGKTEAVARSFKGSMILSIVHRVSLGSVNADRLDLEALTDIAGYGGQGTTPAWVCADSCYARSGAKFDAKSWGDAVLFLDEFEQQVHSWLASTTHIAKHRVEILENLRDLIRAILRSPKGRIVIADADLSDRSLDFLQALAGFDLRELTHIVEVEHDAPVVNRTASILDTPQSWLSALTDAIRSGQRCMVHCVGQQANSKYGTMAIARMVSDLAPNLKVLRLDKDTVGDSDNDAYRAMRDLNNELTQWDVVIASPVIETGCSIDVNHFDAVFAISFGMQSADAFRQALARVRANVPRYIYVPAKTVLGRIENGETSPQKLITEIQDKTRVIARHCSKFDTLTNIETANPGGALETWAKFSACLNADFKNFQATICSGLMDDGYKIVYASHGTKEDKDLLNEGLIAARDANCDEDNLNVANAETPTKSQADKLSQAKALSYDQRCQLRNFLTLEALALPEGEKITPDDVENYRSGYVFKQRWHYNLLNKSVIEDENRASLEGAFYALSGRGMTATDVVRGYQAITIEAAIGLGWLETLNAITNTNDLITEDAFDRLATRYRYAKKDADRFLKINLAPDTDHLGVKIARKLLVRCGLKLATVERGSTRTNRAYKYAVTHGLSTWKVADGGLPDAWNADSRDELFDRWATRDEQRAIEREERREEMTFDRETQELMEETNSLGNLSELDSVLSINDVSAKTQEEYKETSGHIVSNTHGATVTAADEKGVFGGLGNSGHAKNSLDLTQTITSCFGFLQDSQKWVLGRWNALRNAFIDQNGVALPATHITLDGMTAQIT